MKLSIALLALLPAVLGAPVAVDTIESGIETAGGILKEPLGTDPAANAVDHLGGIVKGVPLDGAKNPDILNARDGDLISVGDARILIELELVDLSERDGDDSVVPLSALTGPGGVTGAGEVAGVGYLTGPGGVTGAGEVAGAGSLTSRGGVAGAGEATGAGSLTSLGGVVGAGEVAGAGSIGAAGPLSGLSGKRELSQAETLANARKALSAAEGDYERYPNEITKAAYMNAIATVQALQASST